MSHSELKTNAWVGIQGSVDPGPRPLKLDMVIPVFCRTIGLATLGGPKKADSCDPIWPAESGTPHTNSSKLLESPRWYRKCGNLNHT